MGMVRLLLLTALSVIFIVVKAEDDTITCPKESFWREKECYGTDINAPENSKYRFRPGFLRHPRTKLDPGCCKCPSEANVVDGDCVFTSGWGKLIALPDSCCDGSRQNGDYINPFDPARDLYKGFTGKSFFRSVPAPPNINNDYQTRGLLSFGSCTANGQQGICQSTSSCGGVAVPGFCPGSRDIQCCVSSSRTSSLLPARIRSPSTTSSSSSNNANRAPLVDWISLQDRNYQYQSAREGRVGASTVRGLCSNFYKVWNAYPPINVDSQELVDAMGMSWITNTCTVRGTLALAGIGIYPADIGRVKWIGRGKRYLIRVAEIVPFLTATFGPAIAKGKTRKTNTFESNGIEQKAWLPPAEIMGVAGMIHFGDCIFTDATGHIDVWDGVNIRMENFFHRCRTIQVFDVCRPTPNPDYSAWLQHLRKTKAVA